MEHFQTDEADKALAIYKNDSSEANLDNLYNSIDNVILTVTNKIASGFSKKHPSDFEDIQQNVRISIYKILPKLANISVSGNQVIAVVVKATVWSFKSRYAAYKRKTPIKFSYSEPHSWMPEHEVPVEVQLEFVIGMEQFDNTTGENIFGTVEKFFMVPKAWVNSNQYEGMYLKSLPDEVFNKALSKNRYKEKEGLVKFCLLSLIEGRDASTILISQKWKETNATFWLKYSLVLLRLALLETVI